MNKSAAYMTEGPLLKKIILYALPVIFTGVLQLLFNAADLVIVGRFAGSLSVAAVGATGSLINLIVTLSLHGYCPHPPRPRPRYPRAGSFHSGR